MKYIKKLRLNENVESSIEDLFVSVTDSIGTNALKVEKNGDEYRIFIIIEIDGIETIIESRV